MAITVDIDYVGWRHYRRLGSGWRHWYVEELGTNAVLVNTTDTSIVTMRQIPPINIMAGQSNSCAQLSMLDPAEVCLIRTYAEVLDAAHTYDISLDYRFDVAVVTASLSVQRTSDHFHWNEGAQAWQAAAALVTLPNVVDRTRTTFVTNVQTAVTDKLIITILNDTAMAPTTHNLYVYKVDMRD